MHCAVVLLVLLARTVIVRFFDTSTSSFLIDVHILRDRSGAIDHSMVAKKAKFVAKS